MKKVDEHEDFHGRCLYSGTVSSLQRTFCPECGNPMTWTEVDPEEIERLALRKQLLAAQEGE